MTRHYSEDEAIAAIAELTRPRLVSFVKLRIVQPVQSETGALYRDVDIARLRLLVDLTESYRLDDDALVMVMSLVDQVNSLRGDMESLMLALSEEAPEVRARLRALIVTR